MLPVSRYAVFKKMKKENGTGPRKDLKSSPVFLNTRMQIIRVTLQTQGMCLASFTWAGEAAVLARSADKICKDESP